MVNGWGLAVAFALRGLLDQTNSFGFDLAEEFVAAFADGLLAGGVEVAGEAAEFGEGFVAGPLLLTAVALEVGVLRVEQRVDALFVEEAGFLEVEAEEVPRGAEVLAELLVLELGGDLEFGEEVGLELVEVGLEIRRDDEVA